MVAYNFKEQFAPAIKSGVKNQTIRRDGKRRHAVAGESLQLYTGMRTRKCSKIVSVDPECLGSHHIRIDINATEIVSISVDGVMIENLDAFAVRDGFKSIGDMHAFFLAMNGAGVFNGTLIEWRKPK